MKLVRDVWGYVEIHGSRHGIQRFLYFSLSTSEHLLQNRSFVDMASKQNPASFPSPIDIDSEKPTCDW
jgi:hypothetical protein